jgi:hypothetical protein
MRVARALIPLANSRAQKSINDYYVSRVTINWSDSHGKILKGHEENIVYRLKKKNSVEGFV